MKILMVSMYSNHFFRWVKQLEDSGIEIYWIDVFDSNTHVNKIDFVHQIIGWRNKIIYPGRYFVKNRIPKLYDFINLFNQRKLIKVFEKKIDEIKPDVVQSFVLQSGAYPILKIMSKYPQIKWVYSAWGNDLYYRQNNYRDLKKIEMVLPKIHFLFTDCYRDYEVAKKRGFSGEFLGVYPGGGGYDLFANAKYIRKNQDRKIILIKGYESKLGRCNIVLKALKKIKRHLEEFEIFVFGANDKVIEFSRLNGLDEWNNLKIKKQISHNDVLRLMGKSLIYIGNSISDGMPNTLLEAIIMGAFPIQSNPGKATEEIIINGKNGLLIKNPEDSGEIASLIQLITENRNMISSGVEYNNNYIKPKLEEKYIKSKVLEKYHYLKNSI